MKYYSPIRCYSTDTHYNWVTLKDLMLSERSPLQEATCNRVPLIHNVQNGQILRDAKQTTGCQRLREGEMPRSCLMGTGLSLQAKNVFCN